MINKMISIVFLSVISVFSVAYTLAAGDIKLDTALYYNPPFLMKTGDGKVGGICVDIMKRVADVPNIDINYKTDFLPNKRLMFWAIAGRYDFVACIGQLESKAVQRVAIYSKTQLFNYDYVAVARKGDNVSISSLDDVRALGKDGMLLIPSNLSIVERLKKEGGFIIDDGVGPIEKNLKKLLHNRGRFVVASSIQIKWALKRKEFQGKFRQLPFIFKRIPAYFVYSKMASDEEERQAMEKALATLSNTGEIKRIVHRYTN